MVLLPDEAEAPEGKPRGTQSLAAAMSRAIADGSWIVSDEWKASGPAVQRAGLNMEGQVCHVDTFRNPATGVHSNDIESEFAKFKAWIPEK